MKSKLICIAAFWLCACSNATSINGGNSILSNIPDTILNSQLLDSLNGWQGWCGMLDSCAQTFSLDIPPGSSSLRSPSFQPIWTPNTTWIRRDFFGLSSGVYRLSTWAKTAPAFGLAAKPNAFGTFGIKVGTSTSSLTANELGTEGARVAGQSWQLFSQLDTLSLTPFDTVRVFLTGGSSDTANSWNVLYNNVSLIKVK